MTALLKLLLLAIALVGSARATGQFSLSCYDQHLFNNRLWAICRRINGTYLITSISLVNIVENINGQLQWSNGRFQLSCSNCVLQNSSQLACNCRRMDQSVAATILNLNDHIANIDGILKYQA